MRIIQEAPNQLVVEESATGMRTAGTAVAAAALVLVAASLLGNSKPLMVVGGVMLIVGAMLALLPRPVAFCFDRGARRLIVTRRRGFSKVTQYEEYRLSDVVDVETQRSTAGRGSTWRVAVRLTDGRELPFTSYYTSGRDAKEAVATEIRQFLELRSGSSQFGGASTPDAVNRMIRRGNLRGGIMLAIFGAVFGSVGGALLFRETTRLRSWLPVEATVISTNVVSHSSKDGRTYSPLVVYNYSVNGRTYTSRHTLPISESRSGHWAYNVIARFTPGQHYTAWFNPGDPSDAFIVRAHSTVAVVFFGIGLILFIFGVALSVSGRQESRRPAGQPLAQSV